MTWIEERVEDLEFDLAEAERRVENALDLVDQARLARSGHTHLPEVDVGELLDQLHEALTR